jgi:hypothetical protein
MPNNIVSLSTEAFSISREEIAEYFRGIKSQDVQDILSESWNRPALVLPLPEVERLSLFWKLNPQHIMCLVMEYGFQRLISGQIFLTNVEEFTDKYRLVPEEFILTYAKLNKLNAARAKKTGGLIEYHQTVLPIHIES